MATVLRLALTMLLIGSVIGQFDMFAEPTEQTVKAGETPWFKIDVVEVGPAMPVTLTTRDGCTVEPAMLIPSDGTALSCRLPVGTHSVVVTGTSAYHTEAVTVTLTVEPWRVWLPVITGLTE